MKKILTYIFISVCPLCVMGQVKQMNLEECIAAALSNNLSMQMEKKNLEKAKILTGTAFDAPNTGIELSQDATGGGSMENGLKFSQEFDFPTLYIGKRKALKANYSVAQGEYMEKSNRLAGSVVSAYHSLVYARHKVSLLEEQVALFADFVKVASARYEAGDASKLELLNAERILAKGEKELLDAKLMMDSYCLTLMNLTGEENEIIPSDEELSVLDMPDIKGELEPDATFRGQLRNLELKQSERNLGITKQEFLPGFFVAATTQLLLKGFNPYDVERPRFEKGNFMGFQVGVTIPLFFGAKRAQMLAAKRDVEIAKLRVDEERLQINKEYSEAKNEFKAARKVLDYYEEKGVEQANEIMRLARVSYDLGEIDYIEYVQNMETVSSLRVEYLESIERYNQAIIKLETLKGIL